MSALRKALEEILWARSFEREPTAYQKRVETIAKIALSDYAESPSQLSKAIEFLEAFEAENLLNERESVGIECSQAEYFEAASATSKAAFMFRASLNRKDSV